MITEFPLHIDIFALFIFLGAVQGFFLSYFFLSKHNRKIKANVYLGILLIASSLLCFDILFSYTNFMFQVIYLVDSTEPLNFIIGPAFYLYIVAKVDESRIKNYFYHFLPFFIYLASSILYQFQSVEFKYNSYLDQYHPELEKVPAEITSFINPLIIKDYVNELTIISIAIYTILSAIFLIKNRKIESNHSKGKLLKFLWIDVALMTTILLIIIFVKSYFPYDLGDYIIIVAICLFIYSISFKVIRDSGFFTKPTDESKYRKSVLSEDAKSKILNNLNIELENKYYLSPKPSLPDLAKKINTSPNYLSQVINEKLNMSFLDLINHHRIEEAKKMILDPELNETIEGIGYLVGFNSKSTFHSAFKKITGQTPTQFKDSQN